MDLWTPSSFIIIIFRSGHPYPQKQVATKKDMYSYIALLPNPYRKPSMASQ